MRPFTVTGYFCGLQVPAVVCAAVLVGGWAIAQQIQLGFADPARSKLTPPRVNTVSGRTAARLEQAKALAADANWDEAADIYCELIAIDSDEVVAIDEMRYVSLRTYCHWRLAGLADEALAEYRREVDPSAERLYRDGLRARDSKPLRRVVDEFFCSSWGDDALLALGDIALERADYAAARRAWQQISPQLKSPAGLDPWVALRDIDWSAHGPEVERRWRERRGPPDWLSYPDSQLDLADVRARLVLVSIRAGQRERAALELELLRHFHADAAGRLGGQEVAYAEALGRLLVSAAEWPAEPRAWDWPTFAGGPARAAVAAPLGPDLRPAWRAAVGLAAAEQPRVDSLRNVSALGGEPVVVASQMPIRESQRPLSCFPIAVGGDVLFADRGGIRAVELATGEPAITASGVVDRSEPIEASGASRFARRSVGFAYGVPRYTLSANNQLVFGRVGSVATARFEGGRSPADELVGFDLSREGLLAIRIERPGENWSFDGAPLSDGRRLFVALRRSDVAPHAYVACYDASSGSELWRTPIGSADTPAAGALDEVSHNLVTLVDDRIYFNSNLGLVAALEADDGKICWLHRYERQGKRANMARSLGPAYFDRDPSPAVFYEGLVIVAAADTPAIFALDAETGRRAWASEAFPDAKHVLAVVDENLIVAGNRLAAVDVRSGTTRFVWPESEHAGIRGMGRGVVAGSEVFWPTRREIYVLDAASGEQTRPPIDLRPISDHGANLVAARGRLIVAGYDKLMALGPAGAPRDEANGAARPGGNERLAAPVSQANQFSTLTRDRIIYE